MLDQTLKGFPGKVQPVKLRVAPLQLGDDPQRLGIVVKTAIVGHQLIEFVFARMAKGRVPKIVAQGQGFGQILVHMKRPGKGTGNLGNLNRMGQPRAVMVTLVIDENLGLVLETAKGGGMDDPVTVALKRGARWQVTFGKQPTPALLRLAGIGCQTKS